MQQFRRHGGIDVAVVNIGLTGACEVCPRRNADQTARKRQAQLLQPQAKRVNKSSASGLAAEQNLACGISLGEQILITYDRIVQRRRKAILRGQTVGCAEYTHTALVRECGSKTLCIVQIAAGIAAAVQIEHNALTPLVFRHDPRALKWAEVMVADDHIAPVDGLHQLAKLVLPLPGNLQRTVGDKWFKEIELCSHQLRRQTHRYRSFQKTFQ